MHGYGLSHSEGEILPKMNNKIDTPKYAAPKYIHTSVENGDIKENVDGGCLVGLRNKIEIPKFINGIVKSTPLSLSDVIVKSVIAKSARCENKLNYRIDDFGIQIALV